MKSLFKKAAAFVLVFASVATAATLISKDEVNQKVAAITAPYNVDGSKMELSFTDLNVSELRALDFGLKLLVAKKGATNELVFKIDDTSYHYGNGSTPTVNADISLKLDLMKIFGQDVLNSAAADFEDLAKSMASEYTKKYGAAVTLDAKMVEVLKDSAGNVTQAKVRLGAAIDFAKLPEGLEVANVEFQSFQSELTINAAGMGGKLTLVMNPLNRSFQSDEPGLKEFIEALLSDDTAMYEQLADFAAMLNGLAESIVNAEGQQQH
ncbi:hypothetical protein D3C87_1067490 [compost metagenome]